MSNCPACAAAEWKPRTDAYRNGCLSCQARALAAIGGDPNDVGTMRRLFGAERLDEGRREFDRWVSAIRQAKAQGQAARP